MRALRLLVWVAVLAGLVAAVWARPSSPTVGDDRHVTCDAPTHYACGRQIGAKQRARVKAAIFSPHTKVLVAWAQTVEGNATLSTYLAMHSRELPELLDEVRGIADGAGVPFYPDLFALNMDVEISSKFLPATADAAHFSKGCSDVHLILPEHNVQGWGHNEDGELSDLNDFYFVTANISGFRYFSMAYAGRLAGAPATTGSARRTGSTF